MIKKRLIGILTIINGRAVQSFGYKEYLPLGDPKLIVENLDRWEADEIIVLCIEKDRYSKGPDFNLIEQLGKMGIATPLIYGGGIRNLEDALRVIKLGADRIIVDSLIRNNQSILDLIARELGAQAIIANIPLRESNGQLYWLDHQTKKEILVNEGTISSLSHDRFSEIMLTDWSNEGKKNSFNKEILHRFPLKNKPLLLFGGISEKKQINHLIGYEKVFGVGIGNFLNYKEHAIQSLKTRINNKELRKPYYSKS